METYEMLYSSFLESRSVKDTSFLSGFLHLRVVWPLLKMPNSQNVYQQAKQMHMCTEWRHLFLETEELWSMKFLNMLEISFGSVQSILKDNLNRVRMPPHSCCTPTHSAMCKNVWLRTNCYSAPFPFTICSDTWLLFSQTMQDGVKGKDV